MMKDLVRATVVAFLFTALVRIPADAQGYPYLSPPGVVQYDPAAPNGIGMEPYATPYHMPPQAQTSYSEIFDPRGSIKPKAAAQLGLGLFQPSWQDDSFKVLVPASVEPAFGFSGIGRSDDFTYQPSLTVQFGVDGPEAFGNNTAFIYTQLELVGKLDEDPMAGVAGSTFNTASTIRLRDFRMQVADWSFPAMPKRKTFVAIQGGPVVKEYEERDIARFTFLLDISYRDIFQEYRSTVRNGDNSSQVASTADFKGLGIATVGKLRLPFGPVLEPLIIRKTSDGVETERTIKHINQFAAFFNVFGNFAVGRNDRFSSIIVDVESPGLTDISSQSKLDKTEFVASGGVDAGLEWNTIRNEKLISAIAAFTLEASSNIGPIDPQAMVPRSNDFLIYGFLVAAAIQF